MAEGQYTKEIREWLATLSIDQKKEYLDRLEKCPFLLYTPYPTQRKFHNSKARIRGFFGGNRSGKTRALVQEVLWYATGLHPFKPELREKVPLHVWVVSLDFPSSRDVVQPMIREILGSGYLKSWRETDKMIELTNGSTIAFKSVDSGWEKFQGTAKHLIAFDEEPSHKVWQECRMRIVSTRGDIMIAMTPLHGMTFIYDELYEPWLEARRPASEIECFISRTADNPFIAREEIKRIEDTFFDEEKEARLEGTFVEFAGLIYKEYSRNVHLIQPFAIPNHWVRIRGIDPGLNNPTACVWWAISPQNEHYIYDEYYQKDKTIREFAQDIKSQTGNANISYTVIDPSSGNRNPAHPELRSIREEYSKHGIWTMMGNNNVEYGINAVKQLLRVNPATGRPSLYIFDNLFNFKKEMIRYRYDTFRHHIEESNAKEKPKKVMDHLMDAMRYIAASSPRYVNKVEMASISKMSFKPTRS